MKSSQYYYLVVSSLNPGSPALHAEISFDKHRSNRDPVTCRSQANRDFDQSTHALSLGHSLLGRSHII